MPCGSTGAEVASGIRRHALCAGRSPMLYQAYQSHADLMWLPRAAARAFVPVLGDLHPDWLEAPPLRRLAAACEVFDLVKLTHSRPPFRIDSVVVGGREVAV